MSERNMHCTAHIHTNTYNIIWIQVIWYDITKKTIHNISYFAGAIPFYPKARIENIPSPWLYETSGSSGNSSQCAVAEITNRAQQQQHQENAQNKII